MVTDLPITVVVDNDLVFLLGDDFLIYADRMNETWLFFYWSIDLLRLLCLLLIPSHATTSNVTVLSWKASLHSVQ